MTDKEGRGRNAANAGASRSEDAETETDVGPAEKAISAADAVIADIDDEDEREDLQDAARKALVSRFWTSARGFWGKNGDRLAWWLPLLLLIIAFANLATQYGMNVWNREIFDALEKKDSGHVLFLAEIFVPLAIASVAVVVFEVQARMTTQRRWRAWLTSKTVDRWLANGHYYQLNLVSGDHENPEYRISEDMRVATDAPVDFVNGVFGAAMSALTFIAVLWAIGGALRIPGTSFEIPGFLVVAAILYAIIASGSMIFIGRRFVRTSEDKNQSEAEFRYALTRVRENGESIALLGGEREERAGIDRGLQRVIYRWSQLCGQYMRTTIVSQGSTLVAPVIPIILCSPKYLDGSMTLGQVMQAASAFTIVQRAFSWLVDNYPRLAEWSASARRVASLMVSLDALEKAKEGEAAGLIVHGETDKAALRLVDLSVTLDDGTAVVDDTEVVIEAGERVLIAGESGTGKSTLVRAIAGLWPWGGGEIEINPDSRLFLLPQKPYVPSGTLLRAAAYPEAAEEVDPKEVAQALEKTGLGHLADRLDEEAPWDQTMSGGEKQRLAFARALLLKPGIIVLDEATSALDPTSQDSLMALISTELKDATIVSVGHRPELEQFHSRKIVLERRKSGAKLVSDIHLIRRPGRTKLIKKWLRARKRRRNARRRQREGAA